MSRFDYVKYDAEGQLIQNAFKEMVSTIENTVLAQLESPRAKALALTKLEEFYMWVGKAIRDDQIERNKNQAKIVPHESSGHADGDVE